MNEEKVLNRMKKEHGGQSRSKEPSLKKVNLLESMMKKDRGSKTHERKQSMRGSHRDEPRLTRRKSLRA